MVVSNASPSRTDMMAMPCTAMAPLISTLSPGWAPRGEIVDAGRDQADAGGVDVDAVALAAVHDLGVAGDDRHARLCGRCLHRLHDPPEIFHRQPLFEDQPGGQRQRLRAAHGQVVDRAVHGQRADVAARERRAG